VVVIVRRLETVHG